MSSIPSEKSNVSCLGVFDDPAYARLAVENAAQVPVRLAVPARRVRQLSAGGSGTTVVRRLPGPGRHRVGRARQREQPPPLPARRDQAAATAPGDAPRVELAPVRPVPRDADRHRQPDARPVLHRRRGAHQRHRRLPQDPRRLQLAPQAAGPPPRQRAAVPVRGVAAGMEGRDRVLGSRR